MKGSKSVSDPKDEEEIKVQYVKPIRGNTLPPQYSKEISRYQPSEKERIRAMKDALRAVRQFTSEGNLSRNGNLNTTTMKEMWDYESQEPFLGKFRDVYKKAPEKSKSSQVKPKNECELCGGNHKAEQCPHERKFSLGMDTTSSDTKEKLPDGKSKSVDYSNPQWKGPTIWRPAQSVNGITNLVKYNCTRGTLTPENLLELDPTKDQLGMGRKQILLDSKTKVWVDEQNRMNTEKTLGHDKSHEEARGIMHPDPRVSIKPPTESQKRGTVITSEKDTPQPACASQEFVKHIADPLVDKGWNLHLKFGKGESQGNQFIQSSSPQEPTARTDRKEKVSKPQISRQIPLEMGTGGGGGGGKKGGNGGKRPPEDKIDIEDHPSEGERDYSSSETSLELNLDPQQLASVRLDRPLLRLRLMPRRKRIIATAPGGGGTPPPMGGGTVTVPLPERQNGTGTNQPIEGGEGPPQAPNGVGGGTGPLLSERDRRIPQQPVGGGGAPPPGGNGNGNGNSNGSRGGGRPPPPRGNGGDDGDDDGDGGGDDSPLPSDHGQPRHHQGQRDRWVYVVQGPPGPPGQPGQNGKDGWDGQMPQLPRGMINVPGVAPAPLDTTGLENSFENLGRTMVDVLAMQQQTNLTLQDQVRRANDAQMEQTLAMHDLADMTEQRTYDSMFAAVPIYHGKDDEDFDEWADQLEALCEISH